VARTSTSAASSAAHSLSPSGRRPARPLAGLHLEGSKVAEVVMSAPRGDAVELLAVTALDARDRTLVTEDGREAVPVVLPYDV